jgi:Domain of unknown function (DUF4190)/Domain of unknown function (DUF1707)
VTSDPAPGTSGFPLPPSQPTPSQPAPTQPYGRPAYGPPSYGASPYGQPPYGQGGYGGYGGYPPPYAQQPRYVQPGMLAAQADRERTIDVLKAAYSEGRLNKDEFDNRCARAMNARTYADLAGVVADLPSGPGGMQVMPFHGYYPMVSPAAKTNGVAVASMVFGIIPFFGGIPAVILGHVARSQIKQTGERGDGMAVAGLVLGYLWISFWVLLLIVGLAHG